MSISDIRSHLWSKKNKNEADTTVELAKSESSDKKISNLLKAKSDIAKSVAKKFLKTRKENNTSEVQRKRQKKKGASKAEDSKAIKIDVMKLNSMEENQQKDATTSVEHVEKNQEIQKNEENTSASDNKEKITKSKYNPNKRRSGKEPGLSNKKSKNEEKWEGNKGGKQNEQKEKDSLSVKNNTSDEKRDGKGTDQEPKRKKILMV
ncbi:uncharacterized protein LOC120162470 [Hibiscus syriacus]|uniref:uncharacterized protein LOC120162470 n=1 Tax=Hibiscus syriacus TaxID=106335 RepID=UPI0019212A05|nr:uncharacterized protein LOC120162470 [Hibiscus syriacus]